MNLLVGISTTTLFNEYCKEVGLAIDLVNTSHYENAIILRNKSNQIQAMIVRTDRSFIEFIYIQDLNPQFVLGITELLSIVEAINVELRTVEIKEVKEFENVVTKFSKHY